MNRTGTIIIVKTTSGLIQYFTNEEIVLAHYNRNGRLYEIREGKNGRELWHKWHNHMAGVIEIIPARD